MGKATSKKSGSIDKLIKRLFTNTTEYLKIVVSIVVLIIVAIQVVAVIYGMITKATITVGFPKGWLPSVEIKRPDNRETSPTLLGSTSIQPIQRNSVWYCCYIIAIEIAQTVSIDTKLSNNDDDVHMKEVYRCVQICLNVINYYEDEIDGDQGRTKAALARFQQDHGLNRDCKLGKKTWCAILKMIAQEIHGSMPSNEENDQTYAKTTTEDIDRQAARILSNYLTLATLVQLD